MGDRLIDPYEQQLLAVFESCDDEQKGSLDRHGLLNLCHQLQLEEQGTKLMECLLDGAEDRVTFVEFRDGLLALLDEGEGKKESPGTESGLVEALPEREVSPKFVFGKKKYGRRTRPKHTDLNPSENKDDSDTESIGSDTDLSSTLKLESANAQHHKKRKTSVKVLVNRTPDVSESVTEDLLAVDNGVTTSGVFTLGTSDNEVQCLRNAWKRLGVGSDGYLDRNELALVCEHIGMEKVAGEVVKEVFDTLDVDRDNRISFEEFLLLFRGGGRANQTESSSSSLEDNTLRFSNRLGTNAGERQSILCASGDSAYAWTLDANGNGTVNADMVVEVWENAGVPDALLLLHNLGFTEPQVKVTELITVVDSEISGLQAENAGQVVMTATEILQQASLALCVAQVRCMKSTLEQVCRERDKLRFDIAEANERASLLAQEVDEHHSRLEHSNRAHIKSLEAKHADQLKYLTDQLSHERDHLAHQTTVLQSRVRDLEEAEMHQRSEFAAHKEESAALYRENQSLVEQLAHTEVEYATARKELETLDGLRQGMREMELNNDNEKVSLLLEKLEDVQCENTELRDRNDELTMKVESLSLELAAVSLKKSGPQYSLDVVDKRMIEQECITADDVIVAGGGGGAIKRRGDPPLSMSACEESSEEESPRLEKVRRCCSSPHDIDLLDNGTGIQVRTLTPSGSVVDLMLSPDGKIPYSQGDNFDVNPTSRTNARLVQSPPSATETILRAQVNTLKHQLKILTDKLEVFEAEKDQGLKECHDQKSPFSSPQISIIASRNCNAELNTKDQNDCGNTKEQLEQHCRDLKSQLDEVKIEIVKILSERNACSKENCALKTHISDLKTNLVKPFFPHLDNSTTAESSNLLGTFDNVALKEETEPSLKLKSVLNGKDVTPINSREDTMNSNTNNSDSIEAMKREFADKLSMVEEDHMKEKIELLERCTNLESSIELLRQEYERCEDYWAGKLDEERALHDQEQQDFDTKYKGVLAELQSYDDYFQADLGFAGSRRRLATIDENVALESQVTALQEECEDLRLQMTSDRCDMAKQCKMLEDQLKDSEMLVRATQEQFKQYGPAQVPDVLNSRVNWSKDAEGYLLARYKGNPLDNENHLLGPRIPVQSVDAAVQVPDVDSKSWPYKTVNDMYMARDQMISQISELERRKYQIMEEIHEEQNIGFGGNGCQRIACQIEMKIMQSMNARWVQHDERSRHMQMALKQRQRHTDMLLQQTWIKHKKEISELEIILGTTQKNLQQQSLAFKDHLEQLSRNDILVKDLYVENAYLVATVQRLEQRCMALAQMTTDSISV